MQTEYDENVWDYRKSPCEFYTVKMKKDVGLDDNGSDIEITLPAHLEAFILSNTQRIMNNFVREKKRFF